MQNSAGSASGPPIPCTEQTQVPGVTGACEHVHERQDGENNICLEQLSECSQILTTLKGPTLSGVPLIVDEADRTAGCEIKLQTHCFGAKHLNHLRNPSPAFRGSSDRIAQWDSRQCWPTHRYCFDEGRASREAVRLAEIEGLTMSTT